MPCTEYSNVIPLIATSIRSAVSNLGSRTTNAALLHACKCKPCNDLYVVTHARDAQPSDWMSRHIV